jgi:predicted Zn-dependent protease
VRTLLQSTGAFVLISVLVGDLASITSVAGTLPTILLESKYSRGFEREADTMASKWMNYVGLGVEPMIAFLTRVKEKEKGFEGPEFLSTHPATDKRIEYLRTLTE